jgi:urea transport system permease protein
MLAGLAGALYVPQVGIINPGEFSPANSIEIVVWVALGGRGTLVGAAIGAIIVAALKSWLTANYPDVWLFVLGGLFILVTIAMPQGVLGVLERAVKRLKPPPAQPAARQEPAE